ncbi:MAG: hypothetical protein BWY52_02555 [Chloroflexi bacterium ADurb.Bin325]|nr:MAG: hypothetical protein BWY52_02555 [Chloroflexi bacterium ADurb.Bin325]
MKFRSRVWAIALVVALVVSAFGAAITQASARTTSWIVAITYQNVGSNPADVTVNFYPEGSGTPISFTPPGGPLGAGAGASFSIGSVSGVPAGFRGSAVMSSTEPLVATVQQTSPDADVFVRMLSNGFSQADSASQYLVATTLANKFNRTTVFSVQNAADAAVRATVKFYDADNAGALAGQITHVIPAGSAKYIEMDNAATTGLPGGLTSFNGSAIVTAVLDSDGATPANIVAAASELYVTSNLGANFEGVPLSRASNTIYMATALCKAFEMDTNYAVQNASLTDSAQITVQYYNLDGSLKTTDGPYNIGPGQKKSIIGCSPSSGANMAGFTGSAKITSTGAAIVAIGKAAPSAGASPAKQNVFTAFLGEPAGYSKLALPLVRWASDANFTTAKSSRQRTTMAIQNLEASTIKVNVQYFGKSGGTPLATETLTIPGLSKGNSSASTAGALGKDGMAPGEFGYYSDGSFGGGVIISAHPDNPNAKFIAIARHAFPGYAEDYNAQPVP